MSWMNVSLREADPEVADAILHETERQARGLELIASENFVSEAVLEAMGSVLTNKYAEGYPGRRYYGGCEFSDVVERLAIERAKKLFGAEHANVQPHSREPGQPGRLPHRAPAGRHRAGHGPVPRRAPDPRPPAEPLREAVSLRRLRRAQARTRRSTTTRWPRWPRAPPEADRLRRLRLLAHHRLRAHRRHRPRGRGQGRWRTSRTSPAWSSPGCHPSPVPHCDFVTTTTHKTLRGPRGGLVLCQKEYAKDLDRDRLPGPPGRPVRAHHRGQGGGLRRGARSPTSATTSTRCWRTRSALAAAMAAARLSASSPAGRTITCS